ncbi:MAG: hypothetical protein OES09_10475, partial [Gammaproteobacteria bacterium]|nr:hypothetical protein [Gammaproteobacteria bacterium]
EISLLTGQQRGATITAVTAVNAVEVRKSDLQPILEKYPSLVDALSPMQSERLSGNAAQLVLSEQEQEEISQTGLSRFLRNKIRGFFNLGQTGE